MELHYRLTMELAHDKFVEMEKAAEHIRQVKLAKKAQLDLLPRDRVLIMIEAPVGKDPGSKKVRPNAGIRGI